MIQISNIGFNPRNQLCFVLVERIYAKCETLNELRVQRAFIMEPCSHPKIILKIIIFKIIFIFYLSLKILLHSNFHLLLYIFVVNFFSQLSLQLNPLIIIFLFLTLLFYIQIILEYEMKIKLSFQI